MGTYLITASLVLYKTNTKDLEVVLSCVFNSMIDKIFIIDNSPDDTLKFFIQNLVRRFSKTKNVEYEFGHGNIGYGKANNMAITRALKLGAKYHVILNPDIMFKPKVISELFNYMERHPTVGLILPRVVYPNGKLQYLCKLLPSPYDIFGRKFLPKYLYKTRNERYEMHFTGYDKIWNCPILSGCFMFIELDLLRKIGLFDERFFMYFEDFDLMRRIHQIKQTLYYPYVTIIHNHEAAHRKSFFLLKESLISACKYFNKWGWFWDIERKKINHEAILAGEIIN